MASGSQPLAPDARRALAERVLAARLRAGTGDSAATDSVSGESAAAAVLSSAQERMWFLHTMEPTSPAYHITSVSRLAGPVDVVALRAAVDSLLLRHPLLRSGFDAGSDGVPRRWQAATAEPALEVVDLTGEPRHQRESRADELLRWFLLRPFDLASPPLLRMLLVRRGTSEHLLALVVHHIVADGWSLGIIHRDLAQLYTQPAGPHPTSAARFDTFVSSERSWLRAVAGSASRDYWRTQLANLSQVDLPMAGPRPAVATFLGHRHEASVPLPITEGLEQLARQQRTSLFTVLAAGFITLLHRYSGQVDIALGSPVANRDEPELADVVGLFVNSVVLRTDLSGAPTFREVVDRVRGVVLEALEHQRVPFEQVVDDLRPERSLSHNPLFQVMFALQNADAGELRLPGAEAHRIDTHLDIARFDLECTLWRRPSGLNLRLNHRADLISDEAAARIVDGYKRLLAAAIADPDQAVVDLDCFATDELQGVTGRAALPPAAGDITLHSWFSDSAARTPDALAVGDAERWLTFGELHRRALQVADELRRHGIGAGDVVGVGTGRNVDLAVATFGVLMAGAAFLPVNPADPLERRRFVLADSGARALLVNSRTDLDGVLPLVDVRACSSASDPPAATIVDPAQLAYVIYTSGTTGRPKGVAVEHRNVVNTLLACQQLYALGPQDFGLVLAASTFDVCYYELFSTLLAGGRSRLVDREELFDPAAIVNLLSQTTSFHAVPGLMEHLLTALAHRGIDRLPGVRLVMTGGDLVPTTLLRHLADIFPAAQVAVMYGPTETAIFCTTYGMDRTRPTTGYPIGQPLAGAEVRVVDEQGNLLPLGVTGEIWIGGQGVTRGYVNRLEETAQRFVVHDGRRFYRSGDRGRWRIEDGLLEFRGRIDDQVKVRGFRIELGEVESVLTGLPGVRHGVVVAVGHTHSERRLIAYVVPAAEQTEATKVIDDWRSLFDATHVHPVTTERDYTGWNSSYDGAAMPAAHMDDWLAGTVAHVRACLDRQGTDRPSVLEIGCGTGLVLFELATGCRRYVGVDFSAAQVAAVRVRAEHRGLNQVELHVAEAVALPDVGSDFDLVVLNSVVQYMPGVEYLEQVLDNVLALVRPGGAVFVGDVRNLALLAPFHLGVQAARYPQADAEELFRRAQRAATNDAELLLTPGFFVRYANSRDGVGVVQVEPRRGLYSNELTRFRFDAVLWRGPRQDPEPVRWRSWAAEGWDEQQLRAVLHNERPARLGLIGIPHGLLQPEVEHCAAIRTMAGQLTDPPAPGTPVVPQRLRELAQRYGYRASLSWARGDPTGTFDAVLSPAGHPEPEPDWPVADEGGQVANNPGHKLTTRRLRAVVQEGMAQRLPGYMLPSAVVVLDALPYNANGKVDRSRLPTLEVEDSSGRPPTTATEKMVAQAMAEVLGGEEPAAEDDFFAVGGTSLLAIRLTVAMRQKGLILNPQRIFELRTVELLARWHDRPVGPAAVVAEPLPSGVVVARPAGQPPRPGPDRWERLDSVLLTGATGMLGLHLLDDALRRYPQLSLVCLVRAGNDDAAQRRLLERYQWQFPQSPISPAQLRARVRAVAGDLRLPRLGLNPASWRSLAADCQIVLHAGADVRHVAPEREVFEVNTGGTERVLEFAASLTEPSLCHVSTIGVAGRAPDGVDLVFDEEKLDIGQIPTEAYSASKIAAERLVRAFAHDGGGTVVLRIGTVAPNSASGRFQHNVDAHFFSRYVRAVLGLGITADWPDRQFALIPADAMARAIYALSGQFAARGRTFHLQTPHTISHSELARTLRRLGYRVRLVEPDELGPAVLQLAADPQHVEDAGRMLPMLEARPGHLVPLRCDVTADWLSQLGFAYPAIDSDYIARFVAHGVEVGYFPEVAE